MILFPSRFGLGAWQFRNASPGSPAFAKAAAIFREAYALGVRHVDTAASYGEGTSESCVGALTAGFGDVFVATKIRQLETAAEVLASIDQSRSRLGRDRLDLIYLHWPLRGHDLAPTLEGLEAARSRGWTTYVGVCNFTVDQLAEASRSCRMDCLQIGCNLLWRWPEYDVLPYCRDNGIAAVSYSSLAQGLLAAPPRELKDIRGDDPRLKTVFYEKTVYPKILEAITEMGAVADGMGVSLARLAGEWVLNRKGIVAALVGASSPEQLRGAIGDQVPLPGLEAALDRLTGISDALKPWIPDYGNMFKHYP